MTEAIKVEMGAFESLSNDEMLIVDGGASQFAVAVVNISCGIIAGGVGAGLCSLVGTAVGGPAGTVVGGVAGLVVGAVLGYVWADGITSKW